MHIRNSYTRFVVFEKLISCFRLAQDFEKNLNTKCLLMSAIIRFLIVTISVLPICTIAYSQDENSFNYYRQQVIKDSAIEYPFQSAKEIKLLALRTKKKIQGIEHNLTQKTHRYLKSLYKKEQKLKKSILKLDSTAVKTVFSYDPMLQMKMVSNKILKNKSSHANLLFSGYYPNVDSLNCLLKFFNQSGKVHNELYDKALQNLKGAESKIALSDN